MSASLRGLSRKGIGTLELAQGTRVRSRARSVHSHALVERLRASWTLRHPFLRSGDGSDLSKVRRPGISGLFDLDVSPEDWESYALTDKQVEHFHEKGYLADVQILSEEECDILAAEVDSLLVPAHPAKEMWYAFHPLVASGAWRISFAFHDLHWHPRFRIAAYQLLGGPVRFLHDQILRKPPLRRGGPSWFGFHQDWFYWSWTSPMAHLTCWIALDDATVDNGCLQYVPGSHRWGLLPAIPGDCTPALDAVKSVLSQDQASAVDNADRVETRKGFATFHHPLTLHGSDSNTTNAPRRAAVINGIRDGVLSNCVAEPAFLGSFPFVPQGKPMGRADDESDRMYPLLLGGSDETFAGMERVRGPGPDVLGRLPRLSLSLCAGGAS